MLNTNATFTTGDILTNRLFYRHDDSESAEDRFMVVALPSDLASTNVVDSALRDVSQIEVWLNVRIMLVNDHPPSRMHNHTFHVVTRGERLITRNDLDFIDIDTGTDRLNLQYTFLPSDKRHAAIFRAAMPTVTVSTFTQREIDDGLLLLRHTGTEAIFFMQFEVSDEQLVCCGECIQ